MRSILFALTLACACSRSERAPEPGPAPAAAKKDPAAAKKLIAAGAVVLDVRSSGEYAEEHLPNATNVPVEGFADHLAEVDTLAGGDKSRPIVVYCSAGSRAAKAKRVLDDAGYTRVTNGGGLDDLR